MSFLDNAITTRNELNRVINLFPYPCFVKDEDYRYVSCNDLFAEFLGKPKEFIIGKTNAEIDPNFVSQKAEQEDKIVLDTKQTQEYDISVFEGGESQKIRVKKTPLQVDGDWMAMATFTRIEKEEDASTSQKILRQKAFEIGKIGYWEYNINNGSFFWSIEAEQIIPNVRSTWKEFQKTFHPDDREFVISSFERSWKEGKFEIEHRFSTSKGNEKWVKVKSETNFEKKRCYGFIQDITEEKKTQQSLKENQAFLSFLNEKGSVFMSLEKERDIFHELNQAFYEMLGKKGICFLSEIDNQKNTWQLKATTGINKRFLSLLKKAGLDIHNLKGKAVPELNEKYRKGEITEIPIGDSSFLNKALSINISKLALKAFAFEGLWTLGIISNKRVLATLSYASFEKGFTFPEERGKMLVKLANVALERYYYQKKLEERELLFRTIFELSPNPIFISSEKQKTRFVNRKALEMLGYTEAELLRLSPQKIAPSLQGLSIQKKLAEIEKKGFISFESKFKTKTGELIPVIDNVAKIKLNEKDHYLSIITGIKELKEAEAKLKRNQRRLNIAEKNANSGSWEIRLKDNSLSFSENAFRMLEVGPKELDLSKNMFVFEEFMQKNEFLQACAALKSAIKERRDFHRIIAITTKKGNKKLIKVRGNPYCDEKGKLARYSGSGLDITDFSSIKKELEEANAAKDKFFNIIAHDLKGPLSNILALSNMLKEDFDGLKRDELEELVNMMAKASNQGFKLLDNLLDWSRAQTGTIKFTPELISLDAIFEQSAELYQAAFKKKNLTLKTAFTCSTQAFADPDMIFTVLRNLISNAVKFTPRGGTITVGCKPYTKDKSFLHVFVKDKGVGMPSKTLENLFRIDTSVSRPGTEGEKGTGLGMILAQDFIQKNGGTIWVTSKENKGTTVNLTVPLKSK